MGVLIPLKAFVASPSDVKRERDSFERVIAEMNGLVAANLGYVLQAERWEQYSGTSVAGPQAIINPHIEQADIFILIFWARFGTPDSAGAYPTEGEFDLAYDLFRKTGRPRILFYRKNKAVPLEADFDQARRVNEFEKRFWQVGLARRYQRLDEFERMLRADLANQMRELQAGSPASVAVPARAAPLYLGQLTAAPQFVPRDRELERLIQWAQDRHSQRMSIIGRPGIGKTELALQFATKTRSEKSLFPGGVLVADVKGGANVRETLLSWGRTLRLIEGAAGGPEVAGTDVVKALISAELAKDPLPKLIVINDSERIEDSLAFVLGDTNCFYLLTTLDYSHAAEFAGKDNVIRLEEFTTEQALGLIKQYVTTSKPQDSVTANRIVQRLGRDPLSITILGQWLGRQEAAARPSLEQVLAQLTQEGIPAGSLGAELDRAMAVIGRWMDPSTQTAFRALCRLFPGSPSTFSAEAVRFVLDQDGSAIDRLLGMGLLQRDAASGRYAIHANLYAFQKAHPPGEDPYGEAAGRMTGYFVRWLEDHADDERALEQERFNLQAALDITATRGWGQETIAIALPLAAFLSEHGSSEGAEKAVRLALEASRRREDRKAEVEALERLGLLVSARGRNADAIAHYQQALEIAKNAGLRDAQVKLLTRLGYARDRSGESERAEECLVEALRVAQQEGDVGGECGVRTVLGWVYAHRGDYTAARDCWRAGVENLGGRSSFTPQGMPAACDLEADLGWVEDRLGNPKQAERHLDNARMLAARLSLRHRFRVITNLAAAAIHRGDYERAREWLDDRIMDEARAKASMNRLSILEENLAIILLRRGEDDNAEDLLSEGLEHATQTEDPERIGALLTYLGELARHTRRYDEAERYLRVGWALSKRVQNKERLSELGLNLGLLCLETGRTADAGIFLQQALAYAEETGYQWVLSAVLNARARLFLAEGDLPRARAEAERAQEIALKIESKDNLGISFLALAGIEQKEGDGAKAEELARLGMKELRAIGHRLAKTPAGSQTAVA